MNLRYIIYKVFYGIFVLWGVVTLVFILFNVLPGDPARLTLGQRSDVESIENVRKEMNLDKPIFTRYMLYMSDLSPISLARETPTAKEKYHYFKLFSVSQDKALVLKKPYMGRSYQSKRLVWNVLMDALPGTIILAFSAIVFATVFGIALGVFAALKRDTAWDTSAIISSVVGISAPSFFSGLLIAYIFGYYLSQYTGLKMVGSFWVYDFAGQRHFAFKNLILPALTLGIRPLAIITQLTRSALLDVLSQDYVRTAYAKGLKKWQVIWRHALPNALNPVVTAISGWLAELLAGSFFVEFIFSWKGMGKLTVDSLDKFDFPVVMGALLVTATVFVLVNLLTDVVYTWIDPRVKLD